MARPAPPGPRRSRRAVRIAVGAVLPALAVAIGPAGAGSPAAAAGAPAPPPAGVAFDYQLGGASPPAAGVGVVARDRTERPPAGTYGVCYLNAFQTQPGSLGWWRRTHPRLLLRRAGRLVRDPDWPDEVLLDVSTAARRAELGRVLDRWAASCAARGFRAVEGDNLDSWTRSRGRLRRADAVATARRLLRAAHGAGLAVGQKNAPELARPLRRMGFDFAVVEECERYRECGRYEAAYGSRILEIEYASAAGRAAFARACRARGGRVPVLLRDLDLVPAGREGHVEERC